MLKKERWWWWWVLWDTDYEWKAGSEWDLPLAAKSRWILTDWSGQRHDLAIRSSLCRIQQIFLHFCKPTSDGIVNSLSLAQSVDWSILFVQLYEQTIQGAYNALSLSSVDALSPDPRVDVLQCLQKRHSPCHEMDWVGFYWASYLLSSSW